jgi:uncharacterized protein
VKKRIILPAYPRFGKPAPVKLQLQTDAARNQITGHGDGYVVVNGVRREGSVLVSADSLVAWPPRSAGELTEEHLAPLLALAPEIVLLGTGARQQFPGPWLARACAAAAAGLEVMDTPAACRTYNVLLAEGRRVVAALLVAQPPG